MKSYRKVLTFNIKSRRAFINITPQIEECLKESGIKEGLLLCNPMHITSSVFINDDEGGLHRDFEAFWKNWHRKNHTANTIITGMKTMLMPI